MLKPDLSDIEHAILASVEAGGCELWGCEYQPAGRYSVLRIYIDKPTGILVEDCEFVSRQVSAVLDVEDLIPGQYSLEVSSPGFERPLFKLDHYKKFVEQKIKVKLHVEIANRKNWVGHIKEVSDSGEVNLQCDNQVICFNLADVMKANLVIDY